MICSAGKCKYLILTVQIQEISKRILQLSSLHFYDYLYGGKRDFITITPFMKNRQTTVRGKQRRQETVGVVIM
jgi:hypothetical protein